jgi:hypothetical protein
VTVCALVGARIHTVGASTDDLLHLDIFGAYPERANQSEQRSGRSSDEDTNRSLLRIMGSSKLAGGGKHVAVSDARTRGHRPTDPSPKTSLRTWRLRRST